MSPRKVHFTIPGRIGGKGRSRGFIRGGKVAMHTPAKTKSDEGIVRHFAQQEMGYPARLFEGPIYLAIFIQRDYPQSWSAKRKAATHHVTGKPDCDNIIKLISDAMNGVVFQDDSQIAGIDMRRFYKAGGPENVTVLVSEIAQ